MTSYLGKARFAIFPTLILMLSISSPMMADERARGAHVWSGTASSVAASGQQESLPWGIELLLCMASAKVGGTSLADAFSQCAVGN